MSPLKIAQQLSADLTETLYLYEQADLDQNLEMALQRIREAGLLATKLLTFTERTEKRLLKP